MKRIAWLFAAVLLLVVWTAACGSSDKQTTPRKDPKQQEKDAVDMYDRMDREGHMD